jgi:23S rRNA (cytosine1962-C5)-methyltransferase
MLEISLNKKISDKISKGYPWVFKDDIKFNSEIELSEIGEICTFKSQTGKPIAKGYFNKFSKICGRVLTLNTKQNIDKDFIFNTIKYAISKRQKHFKDNFFRAVYAESDNLGGVIIDVYGEYISVQITTQGAFKLLAYIKNALLEILKPKGILVSYNSSSSAEKLAVKKEIIYGEIPEIIEILENNCKYYCNLIEGQKTGYFFDQRANRKFLSTLTKGKELIDFYTHSGGFGVTAGKNAKKTVFVDRSELALNLAKMAVKANKIKNAEFIKADIFDFLKNEQNYETTYDVVNADPPAFIKNAKDVRVGLAGYQKLTKQCLKLVREGGVFAISSCSYFATPALFKQTIQEIISKSDRNFELIFEGKADIDHPSNPMLPESNYLKFLVFKEVC